LKSVLDVRGQDTYSSPWVAHDVCALSFEQARNDLQQNGWHEVLSRTAPTSTQEIGSNPSKAIEGNNDPALS